jgi:hypothetical protein
MDRKEMERHRQRETEKWITVKFYILIRNA